MWICDKIGQEVDLLVSLGERWKVWINYHLFSGTKRFGELQRLLPQISRQVLTMQLRELEQMGMLHRQASRQGSPKVGDTIKRMGSRSQAMFYLKRKRSAVLSGDDIITKSRRVQLS